ncbi:tubulin-tyrosine ligase family-domain-containing protein, partial [Cladochytrium replicatum]
MGCASGVVSNVNGMDTNAWVRRHKEQLPGISPKLWKPLFAMLEEKRKNGQGAVGFDAYEDLQLKTENEVTTVLYTGTETIQPSSRIWIARHVFGFEKETLESQIEADGGARKQLLQLLSQRDPDFGALAAKAQKKKNETGADGVSALTLLLRDRIWEVSEAYQLTVQKDDGSLGVVCNWYVSDAITHLMTHSPNPNTRIRLFFDMTEDTPLAYTLFWNIQPIESNQTLTRDYLQDLQSPIEREMLYYAYFPRTPDADRLAFLQNSLVKEPDPTPPPAAPTATKALATNGRKGKKTDRQPPPPSRVFLPAREGKYKVYSPDLVPKIFGESAASARMELIKDIASADIVWTAQRTEVHGKVYAADSELVENFVTVFPNEEALTLREQFLESVYAVHGIPGRHPSGSIANEGCGTIGAEWYPQSFNLNTQAAAFVCEYWEREAKKKERKGAESNSWIVKPATGTRTAGVSVSHNISEILRQMITGPKIVSKYINTPALVQGRKFELQVLVLVDSLNPLRAYYAPDLIVPAVAPLPYIAGSTDPKRHITSTSEGDTVVTLHELKRELVAKYKVKWNEVLERVAGVIFAGIRAGSYRMKACKGAKGIYGAQVMLDDQMRTYLLGFSNEPVIRGEGVFGDVSGFLFVEGAEEEERKRWEKQFVLLK